MNLKHLFKGEDKRVFLDFASATPVRKEVLDVMQQYSTMHFANPSALYVEARKTKEIMQQARGDVASFLNTAKERIVFTSGGTEANNIAILGVFESARRKGLSKPHIISVLTEHPSVREVFEEIVRRGGEVTLLTPDTDGLISPEQVVSAMKENTVLVSIMYVNNEIGVVQPIKEIARAIRSQQSIVNSQKDSHLKTNDYGLKTVFFHTDACQAALFYTLDVSTLGVDLLTLDGLKVGGPVGVGCVYVKSGVEVSPVMFGGGQESGLRSGTENVAGMVGFAKALTFAKAERKELSERLEKLRDYFIDELVKRFPDAQLNGSRKHRAPNNVNMCFKSVDAEYLVVALDTYGVCASYSSSCRTLKEDSSSYVVESLGKPDCALSSIRFTLGSTTTKSDIDFALEALEKAVEQVSR
jgi:cysteine desulfurase